MENKCEYSIQSSYRFLNKDWDYYLCKKSEGNPLDSNSSVCVYSGMAECCDKVKESELEVKLK